jgi:hypothetical protein
MTMRCRRHIRERAIKFGGFNHGVPLGHPAMLEPVKKRHRNHKSIWHEELLR